jgi:hypothetical protein
MAKIRGVLDRVERELSPQRLRDLTEHRLSYFVSVLGNAGAAETTIAGHVAHIKAAGIRVYESPKDPGRVRYASAHDLGRSFGERWAARLMPAQRKELMRHESIETTLHFYVGTDAAWAAFEASRPENLEASGNSLANSATFGPAPLHAENRRKPERRQVVIPMTEIE